eukprot:6326544-Prymnesium_polylepis.1
MQAEKSRRKASQPKVAPADKREQRGGKYGGGLGAVGGTPSKHEGGGAHKVRPQRLCETRRVAGAGGGVFFATRSPFAGVYSLPRLFCVGRLCGRAMAHM